MNTTGKTMLINPAPSYRGKVEENLIVVENGKGVPVYIHRKKSGSTNFEQVAMGTVAAVPGSDAERCMTTPALMFGCGSVDIVEYKDHEFVACFRDEKILLSSYIQLGNIEAWIDANFSKTALV